MPFRPDAVAPSPLRVAYVTASFPVPSEQFIVREVEALREIGVSISVVAIGNQRPTALISMAARCLPAILASPHRAWRTLLEAWRLRGTERRHLAFAARFLEAARLARQLVGFDPSLIHAHFVNHPATVARLLGTWLERPWGASAHARDLYADNLGLAARLTGSSHVVACSETSAAYARAILSPKTGERVHCVRHGVRHRPAPATQPGAPATQPGNGPILAAGRFVPKKGFEILIDALAELERSSNAAFEARLIGSGPDERKLRERVEHRRLDGKVRLEPWKDPKELELTIRNACVVVVPSIIAADGDRDTIPNVLVEALALGIPTIVSALPSIVELGDPEAMMLVPPNDPSALCHALRRLLGSPELAQSLGIRGKGLAARLFDSQQNGLQLLEIFRTSARPKV